MRVDDLDEYSREFYERALMKRCFSLMFAALGMVLLGWVSESGSMAQVKNIAYNSLGATEMEQEISLSQGSGYGFACFCYLMGSISAIGMAIYISPDIASEYEKQILSTQFFVDPAAEEDRDHP